MANQPGPFRKADFVAWLRSLPEGYIVGQAGNICHCPYATYLLLSLHLTDIVVREHAIAWGGRGYRRTHPWLNQFVRAVDAIKPSDSLVTAGRCLHLLED